MTNESQELEEVDRELMDSIANDSIKLLSINLVIFTIFVTILSFSYREAGPEYLLSMMDSIYTITGILFWLGSLIACVISYRFSRRTMLRETYENRGKIPDEQLYLNQVSAAALGSIVAVYSFAVGVIDAFSEQTIGVE
ncbi:hypothetical protein [Natrinema thermotolerans]